MSDSEPNALDSSSNRGYSIATDAFFDTKLHLAFGGATVLRSDGSSFSDPWGSWWFHACLILGNQYDLPGGTVDKEFVDLLTSKKRLLVHNSIVSDHFMMFCPVLLHEKLHGKSWF